MAAATQYATAGRNSMGELFTPMHLMFLAIVVIILFGGKKLPELGKGLGEGLRGFKDGMKGVTDDVNKPGDTAHTTTPKPEESVK
jgi:sec-independent protein translocase protein TatA